MVRLMMGPGHPWDRSQNPSEKRLPYQPQRSTPGQAAVGQPLGKLVEGAFPRATAGTLCLGGNFPVSGLRRPSGFSLLPAPFPKTKPATLLVAGCAAGSVRPLGAHLRDGLLSLYLLGFVLCVS